MAAGIVCRRAATTAVAETFPAAMSARRFASLAAPRFPQAATTASPLPAGKSLRPFAALTTPRLPVAQSLRRFAALTSPRLPAAAAAKASNLGHPSATAPVTPTAAVLRHNHQAATVEQMQALESRIQRLELDCDSRILRVEAVLRKEIGESYDKYVNEKATQNDRISNLGQVVFAEGRRSVYRASTSSAENARAMNQIGKVSWRVVVTVVTAAATTSFAVAQLLRADTKDEQTEVADKVVAARIAELQRDFTTNLAATVERAVGVAMAKEARRKSSSDEDALHAFNARLDDVFAALDERIARAVEAALTKQAATNNKPDGKGGRGT